MLQNAITARRSESVRALTWESASFLDGNGLPHPLRGFAMTKERHFATRRSGKVSLLLSLFLHADAFCESFHETAESCYLADIIL